MKINKENMDTLQLNEEQFQEFNKSEKRFRIKERIINNKKIVLNLYERESKISFAAIFVADIDKYVFQDLIPEHTATTNNEGEVMFCQKKKVTNDNNEIVAANIIIKNIKLDILTEIKTSIQSEE